MLLAPCEPNCKTKLIYTLKSCLNVPTFFTSIIGIINYIFVIFLNLFFIKVSIRQETQHFFNFIMPLVHIVKFTKLLFWGICPHILHCNHIKMGTTASNYSDVNKSTEFFSPWNLLSYQKSVTILPDGKKIIYYCGEIFSQNSAC